MNQPKLELNGSRQFSSWLGEQGISLSFSTYQAGKLFFIGLQRDGRLSVFERTFARCMGVWSSSQTLWVATLYQLWRFENALQPGQLHQEYDRVYVPQLGYTTGDVDTHDIGMSKDGPVFINTLFSCIAKPSEIYSFTPIWQPSFVSKLAAEDRCHLNGLAMRNGQPAFVTCVAASDVNEGWRDHRANGGLVIDVASREIIASGLSMPHSPRWYRNRLWLLNSGTGEFGYIDLELGRFEPIAFCPGYLRGLSFHGDFAIVGLSRPRGNKTFSGLALDEALNNKGATARCALQVIDLNRGDVVHELRIEGVIEELYDVCVLPGVARPMAIGFQSDEIRRILSLKPETSA